MRLFCSRYCITNSLYSCRGVGLLGRRAREQSATAVPPPSPTTIVAERARAHTAGHSACARRLQGPQAASTSHRLHARAARLPGAQVPLPEVPLRRRSQRCGRRPEPLRDPSQDVVPEQEVSRLRFML